MPTNPKTEQYRSLKVLMLDVANRKNKSKELMKARRDKKMGMI